MFNYMEIKQTIESTKAVVSLKLRHIFLNHICACFSPPLLINAINSHLFIFIFLNVLFKIELTALATTFLCVIHPKTQCITTKLDFYELSPALPLQDRQIEVVRPPRV